MSTTRQIGLNVITQWGSFVLRAGIGILLVPFLISELGRDVYGLAILLGVVVSFAEIADMGLRMALGRNLAEALAAKDKDAYSRLASTAAMIWLTVGSILAGCCVAFAPAIVRFLDVTPEITDDAVFLVRAFAAGSVLLAFIQPIFTAVLSSHNRFDTVNKLDAGFGLINGVLIFAAISLTDYGIYAWAVAMFGTKFFFIGLKAVAAWRLFPSLRISPRLVDRESFRKLFSLSGYLFFLQLTNLLSTKADPIILSRLLGPASLALYSPGLTLSSRVRPLVQVLANQLYPVTTKFHTDENKNQMEAVLFVGTRITLCMGIGVFAILGVFSQDICRVWLEAALGADYKVAGYVLLGWTLVDLFQAAAGSQWPIMIGKNKIKFVAYTQFPLSILNIIASVYLVKNTDWGVVGVLVPTVLIGAFRRGLTTLYVNHLLGLRLMHYLREAYLRPAFVFLILIPIAACGAWFFPSANLVELIFRVGLTALLWVVLFLALGLTRSELNMAYGKASSLIRGKLR